MRLFELTEGFWSDTWSEIDSAFEPKCDFCNGHFQGKGEKLQPYGERTTGEPFNVCSVCKAVEQDSTVNEDFDLAAWKASLPPGEGEIAYVIHLGKVREVAVLGKSDSFGGTHEVMITSEGGHQGLLYPTYGEDLFNTEEEAKKTLFKNKLAGKKDKAPWRAPRW